MLALLKRISVPTRRYVLTVSNEGAVLAYIVSGSVMRHWVVTEVDDAARMLLRDILDERPRVPIIFLIDLLEQSYQIDELAKVSPLDRSKAVRLKLDFLFPTFDIRAALRIPGNSNSGSIFSTTPGIRSSGRCCCLSNRPTWSPRSQEQPRNGTTRLGAGPC